MNLFALSARRRPLNRVVTRKTRITNQVGLIREIQRLHQSKTRSNRNSATSLTTQEILKSKYNLYLNQQVSNKKGNSRKVDSSSSKHLFLNLNLLNSKARDSNQLTKSN